MDTSTKQGTLTDCDIEPIHQPGAIQPHGLLLVLQEEDWVIRQVSENSIDILGRTPEQILGQPLEHVFGEESTAALRTWAAEQSLATPTPYATPLVLGGGAGTGQDVLCDAALHRSEGTLVLELEPQTSKEVQPLLGLSVKLQRAVERLQKAAHTDTLLDIAVEEVQALTGMDRVMMYQFDMDWHGRVVAEARQPHMEAYLGLHFPATDIPAQARRLYLENTIRLIPNVAYEPVSVFPEQNPATERPLDMSQSTLRSVSPIHIEYLQNMGVQASMSISVVCRDALWGLIACHHATPRYISRAARSACMILGQVINVMLEAKQEHQRQALGQRFKDVQEQLLKYMIREANFIDGLVRHKPNMLDQTRADGAAIVRGTECICLGQTPSTDQIRRLVDWLDGHMDARVYATHELSVHYEEANTFQDVASGLLAVSLSGRQRFYLLWFQPEEVQTVYWAGNPEKAVVEGEEAGKRLSPRKSFEKWQELQRGKAQPWGRQELETVRQLAEEIVDVVFVKVNEVEQLNQSLVEANEHLTSSQDQLRQLAARLQKIRENERKALSRKVHDVLGQALTGLHMDLARIERYVAPEDVEQHSRIGVMKEAIRETIQIVRGIAHDLRPGILDDLGIVAALEFETQQFEARSGIACTFVSAAQGRVLDPERSTTVFRVFQELMTNVARHAEASEVIVTVRVQDSIFVLELRDNGRGIRPEEALGTKSLGLLGIHERLLPWKGRAEFAGAAGEGTTVTVRLPLALENAPTEGAVP